MSCLGEDSKATLTDDTDHTQAPFIFSKERVDGILHFLSTSSNETLLGVFSLLILVTYAILGRLGLLLIGVAVGIVLHASWEGLDQHGGEVSDSSKSNRRRELSLEVSSRLLDWPKRMVTLDSQTQNRVPKDLSEDLSLADLEYATFQPATAGALRTLTDAVINDYVQSWYEPLLPSESSFPSSCRKILTGFITSLSWHLSRKRTEDTFLQFLTNSSSIVIVFLNELAAAFAAGSSSSMDAQQTVDHYLEQFPESSLANVLSDTQQRKKLNMIADDILSTYLDAKMYNCQPARDFLREVFSGVVLGSTVSSLARSDFINQSIIYLLEDGESEIMHAIDAGVEGARNQGVGKSKASEHPIADPPKSENRQSIQTARDSEEAAVLEVKRLSAMMASQPVPGPELDVVRQKELPETPTSNGDLALNTTHDMEKNPDNAVSGKRSPTTPKRSDEGSMAPVILHGAQVLLDDDGSQNEKEMIKSRPTWDYTLQIKPASTGSTGWIIFRKYSDFLSLHEMLATVSRLNLIQSFSERHPILPPWKNSTRQGLARDLENYLQDAMKHESLADNDRMRRFLEKDAGVPEANSPNQQKFSFPSQSAFETMGKGMLGALTNAPKGVAGSGKAVLDGMTGVFGGAANNKKSIATASQSEPNTAHSNHTSLSPARSSFGDHTSRVNETVDSALPSDNHTNPPKSETTSESASAASAHGPLKDEKDVCVPQTPLSKTSLDLRPPDAESHPKDTANPIHTDPLPETLQTVNQLHKEETPITADETQIAVELIFAVINELYTLSSAWNIRRTLLNAAKSYILRPGSPTLETIRALLQESIIQGHTSDDAMGEYLAKLRENALPTEDELKAWPPPPSEEEKLRTRETARNLFVQRGIPQALTSVMGAAASREALEKIFDSLQVETVARGFVFSILIQGLRVLTL